MDIPQIVPPIRIIKSDVYMLVLKDAKGIYHYFDEDGNYDGYSHDWPVPISDYPIPQGQA